MIQQYAPLPEVCIFGPSCVKPSNYPARHCLLFFGQVCNCSQTGNFWDGFKIEVAGTILFSSDGGDIYEIEFTHFSGGIFLNNSTRDSTLVLFLD